VLLDLRLPGRGNNGLAGGKPALFFKQLVAVSLSSLCAFAFTYGMPWLMISAARASARPSQGGGSPWFGW
jgi:hypothetical protein